MAVAISLHVVKTDVEKPALSCQDGQNDTLPGQSFYPFALSNLVSSTDVIDGAVIIVCTDSAGQFTLLSDTVRNYTIGAHELNCTSTDDSGNANSCTLEITVIGAYYCGYVLNEMLVQPLCLM